MRAKSPSKRTPRRKVGTRSKLTFSTFTSSLSSQLAGERALALQAMNRPEKEGVTNRTKAFAGALAIVGVLVMVAYALAQHGLSQVAPTLLSKPTGSNDLTCDFSFASTYLEHRTITIFGGVRVETGEVDCKGEFFIITQTSNSAGDVLSVKKKRA